MALVPRSRDSPAALPSPGACFGAPLPLLLLPLAFSLQFWSIARCEPGFPIPPPPSAPGGAKTPLTRCGPELCLLAVGFSQARREGGPAGAFCCRALLCVGRGVSCSPPGNLGRAKGVNQKGDSDPGDHHPGDRCSLPNLPSASAQERGAGTRACQGSWQGWQERLGHRTERSLGANEPRPGAVGRGSSRPA